MTIRARSFAGNKGLHIVRWMHIIVGGRGDLHAIKSIWCLHVSFRVCNFSAEREGHHLQHICAMHCTSPWTPAGGIPFLSNHLRASDSRFSISFKLQFMYVPSRQFEYRAEREPLYFSTVCPLYLHFFLMLDIVCIFKAVYCHMHSSSRSWSFT